MTNLQIDAAFELFKVSHSNLTEDQRLEVLEDVSLAIEKTLDFETFLKSQNSQHELSKFDVDKIYRLMVLTSKVNFS